MASGCGNSDKNLEDDAKKAEIASGSIILYKPVGTSKRPLMHDEHVTQ